MFVFFKFLNYETTRRDSRGSGEKIGKKIKSAEFSKVTEYIYDQAARKLTDEVKNQATTKPKE